MPILDVAPWGFAKKKESQARKETEEKKKHNMEFLELPGGGSHQPSTGVRRTGGAQAVELEDDLVSFRDPGHRAGPGGFD